MARWTLEALGWHADLEFERAECAELVVGRVAIEYGGLYRVFLPDRLRPATRAEVGEVTAALPGRWRHEDPLEVPAVGDWVGLRQSGDGWAIDHRFARRTQFVRQAAGRRTHPQVVGANVDVVFVVTSLDHDFNPRRIERYLTAILDGGATPVVVLSKADLSGRADIARAALADSAADAPIEVVSAHEGRGLDRLRAHLGRGRTGALTGSSGVGKSTLVNALVGSPIQQTRAVRRQDSKGRHTTTHRELILLGPDEGLLVDTPGMRELQLWRPSRGVQEAFEDVEAIAERCRFRDCGHRAEPGCAVRAAVDAGALSAARVVSYLKLRDEAGPRARRTRGPARGRRRPER